MAAPWRIGISKILGQLYFLSKDSQNSLVISTECCLCCCCVAQQIGDVLLKGDLDISIVPPLFNLPLLGRLWVHLPPNCFVQDVISVATGEVKGKTCVFS